MQWTLGDAEGLRRQSTDPPPVHELAWQPRRARPTWTGRVAWQTPLSHGKESSSSCGRMTFEAAKAMASFLPTSRRCSLRQGSSCGPRLEAFLRCASSHGWCTTPAKVCCQRTLRGGISGYWLVSDRLRQVMETVDAGAFAFVEADYRLVDGSKGPSRLLCDVVRTLDPLDEEASQLNVEISDEFQDGKFYGVDWRCAVGIQALKCSALRTWSRSSSTEESSAIDSSRIPLSRPELLQPQTRMA